MPNMSCVPFSNVKLTDLGHAVITTEMNAIAALAGRVDESFSRACELILACEGRVVVLGMGKSGHIGNKVAATLASTGTPAFFVHPGEASHGDLGMITAKDVVLAFSNSGETEEFFTILPIMKRLGVPLIALTGNTRSTLAQQADAHIDVSVSQEACPLGLAPTASTTAALVMGDALAIALLGARNFTCEDFARSHPGGRLGRRLLLRVGNIMRSGEDLPAINSAANISDALLEITRKGLGMTAVVDAGNRVLGIYTDGDLRRTLDLKIDVHTTCIAKMMTHQCRTIKPSLLAAEALQVMESAKVNGLLVVDDQQRLIGALNLHDLLRARVL